ncbi:hypothetical protein C5C03_06510 [Clavibacter michiganensis]|nr:hypothetical protein C5C03_06510 [Clavibacter michiganensis]PPF96272.1 hypothetical protein C5C05_07390 [Clavibacter michiganensis]
MLPLVVVPLSIGALASVLGILWARPAFIKIDTDGVAYAEPPAPGWGRVKGTVAVAIGLLANAAASFISLFRAMPQ